MDKWTFKIWCTLCFGLLIGLLTVIKCDSSCDEDSQFQCRGDPTICIPLMRVRDGSKDCPDNSDEECNKDEFKCLVIHQCIPQERVHDGWPDCDDRTDEECSPGQFQCRCGMPRCIDSAKLKDGHKDCDDGSDEDDHQNKTLSCPDEGRLQDLMAVERRRRKRQIDRERTSPSIGKKLYYKFSAILLAAELSPSVESEAKEIYPKAKIGNGNRRIKISAETEVYGSLNSGKVYQTAVNELSSTSVPKYTVPPSGKAGIEYKKLENEKKKRNLAKVKNADKQTNDDKYKKLDKYKSEGNSSSGNSEVMPNDMQSSRSDASETLSNFAFSKRHLLSFRDFKKAARKVLSHGQSALKHRLKRSEHPVTHVPLISTSADSYASLKSLHPTGLVTSMTGTDVIDGRTTEWTTLIEGTFIDGTYAHVVKSTSKIFFTVTKTISATPSSTVVMPTSTLATEKVISETPSASVSEMRRSFENATPNESTDNAEEMPSLISSSADIELEGMLGKQVGFGLLASENYGTGTASLATVALVHESSRTQGNLTPRKLEEKLPVLVPSETVLLDTETSIETMPGVPNTTAPASSSVETSVEPVMSSRDLEPASAVRSAASTALPASETPPSKEFPVWSGGSEISLRESEKGELALDHVSLNAANVKEMVSTEDKSSNANKTGEHLRKEEGSGGRHEHKKPQDKALANEKLDFDSEEGRNTSTSTTSSGPSDVMLEMDSKMEMESSATITKPSASDHNRQSSEPRDTNPETSSPTSFITEASVISSLFTEDAKDEDSFKSAVKQSEPVTSLPALEDGLAILSSIFPEKGMLNGLMATVESSQPDSAADEVPETSRERILETSTASSDATPSPTLVLAPVSDSLSSVVSVTLMPSIGSLETTSLQSSAEPTTPSIEPSTTAQEPQRNDNSADTAHKRVKRVVNEKVTVLSPDGHILTVDPEVLLSPTTHYTTYTYYTTILQPGGGTSIQSRLHVDSDVAYADISGNFGTHTPHRHTVIDDEQPCCIRTVYEDARRGYVTIPPGDHRPTAVTHTTTFTYYTTRFRDGTSHVDTRKVTETNVTPIPTHFPERIHPETRYATFTRPPADDRHVTHRTTYTYYTTRFIGATPVVDTRYETETNVVPVNGQDVYGLTRRQHTAVSFGSPVHSHPHLVTYTYYTTRYDRGTPVIDTRTEISRVTHLPHEHPHTEDPVLYTGHTHRINPSLYRPNSLTHRTTYTYHTTRFRDGTPIVSTRRVTETNVTPIPTFGPRRPVTRLPHVTTLVTTQYVTRTVPVGVRPVTDTHYHPRDEPYITHRTTFTYYTTKFRGGTSHVETRKETKTNIVPNPTYGYDDGSYTRFGYPGTHYEPEHADVCPVCDQYEPAYPRHAPGTDGRRTRQRARNGETVLPTTATHLTTYTYATTTLQPSGQPPRVRTRQHTVTEVLPDVVLPTRADTSTEPRFGDRIRTRRAVSETSEGKFSSHTLDMDEDDMFNDLDPVKLTTIEEIRPSRRRGPRDTDPRPTYHSRLPNRSQYARRINTFAPNTVVQPSAEIKPTVVTYYSTYTYFTTELSDGVPVVKSREHTVTEVLSDVVVPTVARVSRPRSSRLAHGPRHVRQADDQQRKKVLDASRKYTPLDKKATDTETKQKSVHFKIPAARKLLGVEFGNEYETEELRSTGRVSSAEEGRHISAERADEPYLSVFDPDVAGAEARPVVITPLTHYTTHTYYTTLLKPNGITSVKTSTEVISSTYLPAQHAVHTVPENTRPNARRRKVRRKKLIRKRINHGNQVPCDHCPDGRQRLPLRDSVRYTGSYGRPSFGTRHDQSYKKPEAPVYYPRNYVTSIPVKRHTTVAGHVPYVPKSSEYHEVPEIRPTRVTYYSTYTYFTTELVDGRPVVKSREHTVTELLTDVVVPTVVPVGNDYHRNGRHEAHRGKRDADADSSEDTKLDISEDVNSENSDGIKPDGLEVLKHNSSENVGSGSLDDDKDQNIKDQKPGSEQSATEHMSSESFIFSSKALETVTSTVTPAAGLSSSESVIAIGNPSLVSLEAKPSSIPSLSPSFEESKDSSLSKDSTPSYFSKALRSSEEFSKESFIASGRSNVPTPRLYDSILIASTARPLRDTISLAEKAVFTEELQAQAAEIRHVAVATPVTYYTTHTIYKTILKPGGSSVVESSIQVSSSVYHPLSRSDYRDDARNKHLQPKHYEKEHGHQTRRCKKCEEQAYAAPRRPYRPTFAPAKVHHVHHEPDRKKCSTCVQVESSGDHSRRYIPFRRAPSFVTSIPVRKMTNVGRVLPQKAPNTIEYQEADIKPTRVTFYSTYTYFTTELKDGRPHVRSREHTVTEILTDVIVPTVSPVRGKREAFGEILPTEMAFAPNVQHSDSYEIFPLRRKLLSVTEEEDNILPDDEVLTTSWDDVTDSLQEDLSGNTEDAMDSVDDNQLEEYPAPKAGVSKPDDLETQSITLSPDLLDKEQKGKVFSDYLEYLKYRTTSEKAELLSRDVVSKPYRSEHREDEEAEHFPLSSGHVTEGYDLSPSIKILSRETEFQPNTTTVVTSDVTRNGRITRYTKTIYGTYINGIHAQKATLKSEIIPLSQVASISSTDSNPVSSPSRSLGLVSIKVSKTTRGPVAVHFTTEIHGTYIAGAYAQTARVYTSYQRITATSAKDGPKLRTHSTSATTYSGPRRTGLLSSRILKSREEDGTTFLLVSEIHGTHIGGAYAHLGTYVTRTIAPESTTLPATTSSELPTYKMNEIETGLITISVSDRVSNSTTTRFHYEVHGTFLDGTYAHVPIARTEIIFPSVAEKTSLFNANSNEAIPDFVEEDGRRNKKPFARGRSVEPSSTSASIAYDGTDNLKLGLIEASTRINVNNGTTTRHIFEVHGTYLGSMYAHVPVVSVETVTPTVISYTELTDLMQTDSVVDTGTRSEGNDDADDIFLSEPEETEHVVMGLIDESTRDKVVNGSTTRYVNKIYATYLNGTYAHVPSIEIRTIVAPSVPPSLFSLITPTASYQDEKKYASPIKLLPEELRLSFHGGSEGDQEVEGKDNSNGEEKEEGEEERRAKRYIPPPSGLSYLQSSFTESARDLSENSEEMKLATAPLSDFLLLKPSSPLSMDDISNAIRESLRTVSETQNAQTSKRNAAKMLLSKRKDPGTYTKKPLVRHKRSPTPTRTFFGRSKSSSSSRQFGKFRSGSTEKGSSTRKYSPSTRSYSYTYKPTQISPSKTIPKDILLPKRSRLFPLRNRAHSPSDKSGKDISSSSSVSEESTHTASSSSKSRKFGFAKSTSVDDDFEASEAVVMSVTDQQIPSFTRRPRYRGFTRPSKLPKLNPHPTPTRSTSKNVPTSPTKKPRTLLPSIRGLRKPGSRFGRNEQITPTTTTLDTETSTTKRRFTLTTSSFSIKLKPTASFMADLEDSSDENKVQKDQSRSPKRRTKGYFRGRNSQKQSGPIQPSFDDDNNEVMENKPRALPLPPFGRSRGFKRPSTFDPRTLKEVTSTTTSTIIYITKVPTSPILLQDNEFTEEGEIEKTATPKLPVTVTDIVTTVKTLAVHLGLKTSYATITTTAYSTSTINPEDITIVSKDGNVRTLVSTKTSVPDIEEPMGRQKTLLTEYFVTTTEFDTTSLLAIKVNYGTRTDTVVARHILTTLTSDVSTVYEPQTTTSAGFFQYPYFQNPFLPQIPTPNLEFSLSTSETSVIATETLTETKVLPLLLNGKTLLTTLTSTSVTESTVVQTSVMKVPQIPPPQPPFVFPQPVFILPSLTTEITVHFTAQNGEVFAIVTTVTVPLMPNHGHTRFVRSIEEPCTVFSIKPTKHLTTGSHTPATSQYKIAADDLTQTSSVSSDRESTHASNNVDREHPASQESSKQQKTNKYKDYEYRNSFKKRKLLQFDPEFDPSSEDNPGSPSYGGLPEDHPFRNPYLSMSARSVESEQDTPKRDSDPRIGSELRSNFFLSPGSGYFEDGFSRPIPPVRVVPTRRAYVRRIRPGNVPQPIPEEPYGNLNYPSETFGIRQNAPQFYPSRFAGGQIGPAAGPFVPSYPEESLSFPEQPYRNPQRRPEFVDSSVPPQGRRVIRLRRPGNVPVPQPEILERKPIVNSPPDDYRPLRARGPVVPANTASTQNVRRPAPENNAVPNRPVPPIPVPLTYYTTFTYMTTFLNGPSTAYSTREAVVSNVATEALNPSLIELIRSRGGFTSTQGAPTAVPLGTRAQGPTTTVVNLASRVQVYNSDIYYSRPDLSRPEIPHRDFVSHSAPDSDKEQSVINTLPITEVAAQPKTYYTLFTYYYTLHDGDKSTHSQRSEVISNVATDTEPFIRQKFTNTIDSSGYVTLSPEKELINLGSRAVGGTTTEVNLELRTLVHFDNLRNVVIDRGGISPSLVEIMPTITEEPPSNYLEPGDAEVQDQNTYPQTVPIQPSFSSTPELPQVGGSRNDGATPEIPQDLQVIQTRPFRGPVRVTSAKLQRPGALRSRVFAPRPGVRVRVRPVTSKLARAPDSSPSLANDFVGSLSPSETSFDATPSDVTTPVSVEDETDADVDDDIEGYDVDGSIDAEEGEEIEEVEDESDEEEETRSETSGTPSDLPSGQGRRRLKVTVQRPAGSGVTGEGDQPTRTRPRFYVVTRTGSLGSLRHGSLRPVSVKVTRRPKVTETPRYKTYTTVTSVPVIFGLSTTYRNAIVTSSFLLPSEKTEISSPVLPSKTLVLTYFTTTTYTVPFTVSGDTSYTTFEETNSRVVTETVAPDADLSFVSTTLTEPVPSPSLLPKPDPSERLKLPKTLLPVQVFNNAQTLANQLNVGTRHNLVTKVSNGVTLIIASDAENASPTVTGTLEPTTLTDALLMMDKGYTTVYEPRTFYTTFTFFTTFFSDGKPTISTSEQVVTNVYTIPITQPLTSEVTRTSDIQPVTVIDTTEQLVSATIFSTHTFYATLFNGTETIVTPIEELQSSVVSSTETVTFTKTILPSVTSSPSLRSTEVVPSPSTTETTLYRTVTNFVTLFRGPEPIVSPLEEVMTEVVTLTLDGTAELPTIPIQPSTTELIYTTKTVQTTNTHYVTLFSNGQAILSSITEVAPTVITEILTEGKTTDDLQLLSSSFTEVSSESAPSVSPSSTEEEESQPTYQDLVPSVRTQYTTLTYFTTLFKGSSTILSSREEVATSYITLFVPVPAAGLTSSTSTSTPERTIERSTTEQDLSVTVPTQSNPVRITPTTEVLTFYTTYTYYTTLFRGTETIISDSETVVTQYVTIETTPTDQAVRPTSTFQESIRPTVSDTADVRIEHTVSVLPSVQMPASSVRKPESSYPISTARKEPDDMLMIPSAEIVTPSVLTGTPTTDANGATHILFTDFIVPDSPMTSLSSSETPAVTPALPDYVVSSGGFKPPTTIERFVTRSTIRLLTSDYPETSETRETASDLATTRLTDVNVATQLPMHPTSPYQAEGTQTIGIKPGAVIDLSDVLGNTNLVGNLGETIKGIVNLFAAGKDKNFNITTDSKAAGDTLSTDTVGLPIGGVPVSNSEEPVYIPIGAIGRGTQRPSTSPPRPGLLQPSILLSGFTPVQRGSHDKNIAKSDEHLKAQEGKVANVRTSIVLGTNTIFIEPTASAPEAESTSIFGSDGMIYILSDGDHILTSQGSSFADEPLATPVVVTSDSTSIITGIETIFFGLPDARKPSSESSESSVIPTVTSSIDDVETIFIDTKSQVSEVVGNSQITGETTIFGSFPVLFGTESTGLPSSVNSSASSSSAVPTPRPSFTKTTTGATTIFFPVEDEKSKTSSPGTRYVTSVESVTLTLTLTTSSIYQSQDTSVTVTSVFTTTIPPRTFVSTIIGSRTILGTQPEPTEAVQVIPTVQPSESTTTVTTTTLIFNSIATTVVRTLVIPTKALKPTEVTGSTVSSTGGQSPTTDTTGKPLPAKPTPGRKPIQLFKSPNRPTTPPPTRPMNTGPPLKLFPTRPSTTTTNPPPPKEVTTRKTFRKPGKALVPETDGCPRECNLKNKEVCKQNPDRSWSCQCRPGFFRRDSDECIDVKSYTVLLRVLQMGGNEISYNPDLDDVGSPVYKNLTTTARKAVDEAYKLSSVGHNYVSTNVLGISNTGRRKDGVLVNLTVTLTGDKPTSELELKDELAQSLEAAASEIVSTNASVVSPIIQRVEDVQDFDECADDNYNDCSRSAVCVNLPGTYTCECKDGYQDLEPLLPGRICSGEIKDCDFCNNRGVCIMTEDDEKFCRCYRMYLGKQCEINGLVLAIALPIALALLILTVFCLLCGCRRLRRRRAQKPKQNVFKNMAPPVAGTLDRKAMIIDSSSESSAEQHAKTNQGYDGFGDEATGSTFNREGIRSRSNSIEDRISDDYGVPTVLIPRARHQHPKQVNHPPQHMQQHQRHYQRTHAPYDDQW